MKQKITSLLYSSYNYRIVYEWEDERFYYVQLDEEVIGYIVLRDLIEHGFKFCIDLNDARNGKLVIAFLKQ